MSDTQASENGKTRRPAGLNRLIIPAPLGKPPGAQALTTRDIKRAIHDASVHCRPGGFAEYLVELSRSDVAGDRAIFAGCVLRLLPPVQAQAGGPAVTINLGWLAGRSVAGSAHVTLDQPAPADEIEQMAPADDGDG